MHRPMALLLSVAVLTSCGFPAEDSPSLLDGDQVPPSLAATTTLVTGGPVTVWLIRDNRLSISLRRHPDAGSTAAAIDALNNGVTDTEAALGLRTALPGVGQIIDVTLSGGAATVLLANSFPTIPASDQVLALAQVVFTLTELPGIGRVRFQIDDQSVVIPLPDGSTTEDSVSRDDFVALIAD